MNSLPLSSNRFRWFDHLSALRWLGLLYRRPQQFLDALSTGSGGQQSVTAFLLLVHSIPYVFALSAAGYLFGTSLSGSEFRIGYLASGIAFGMAFGISFGLFFGNLEEKGVVVAFGIAFGIAFGTAAGIARRGIGGGFIGGSYRGFTGGITAGIAAGIAFGIIKADPSRKQTRL